VSALVLSPPLPGVGERVLTPDAQREFWYQPFHQLALAASPDTAPDRAPSHRPAPSARRSSVSPRPPPCSGPPTTRSSPVDWSDRLSDYFADVDLRVLPDAGHFVPLEAPDAFAGAILQRL
jgi:pimeloyl-ACP methyl ester carboxylesterase